MVYEIQNIDDLILILAVFVFLNLPFLCILFLEEKYSICVYWHTYTHTNRGENIWQLPVARKLRHTYLCSFIWRVILSKLVSLQSLIHHDVIVQFPDKNILKAMQEFTCRRAMALLKVFKDVWSNQPISTIKLHKLSKVHWHAVIRKLTGWPVAAFYALLPCDWLIDWMHEWADVQVS